MSIITRNPEIVDARTIAQALACARPGCRCGQQLKEGEYLTHCPLPHNHAHHDRDPSFAVRQFGSRVLVHCFAGCRSADLLQALRERGLWPSRNGEPSRTNAGPGLSLAEFAKAKRLDPAFLRACGVSEARGRDGRLYLVFGYRDLDGRLLPEATRCRLSLQDKPKAKRGGKPALYGLWRLPEFRQGGEVLLVEGESDCLTAWSYGLPAVGLPGKGLTRLLEPELFAGIRTVWVWQEPDAPELPGQVAVRLQAVPGLAVRALIPPDGVKDISEAHCQSMDVPALLAGLQAEAPEVTVRPTIRVQDRQLRDLAAEAVGALTAVNQPPALFLRLGELCQIRQDEDRRPVIVSLDAAGLRYLLSQAADFVRERGQTVVSVPPPRELAEVVLSMPDLPFPPLRGITEVPVLRPDGTLLDQPGYDPATRLYYYPQPGFVLPDLPPRPSQDEAKAAARYLYQELLGDFPFADDASVANTLAALLTPVVRPAVQGPVPLCLIDAPQAGTGKTLLLELIGLLATGRWSPLLSPPIRRDDEEWSKTLTSALLRGWTVIGFDNIEGTLRSPSLAMALTAETYAARRLGSNDMVDLPVNCSWYVTGNNIQLGGDLPRRCYWIRLDAQTARPWFRQDFRHQDLKAWALAQRGQLLAALLTMARAWYVAGRPAADCPTLGSFTAWSQTLGGILAYCGWSGFLGNLDELYERADSEAEELEDFLLALRQRYHGRQFTIRELVADLEDDPDLRAMLPSQINPDRNLSRTLAWLFRRIEDRRFGEYGLRLVRIRTSATNASRWLVDYDAKEKVSC